MAAPLAYFLTWSCYGNWLAGDERGSVDRRHNEYGMPLIEPDSEREHHYVSAMKSPAVTLATTARQIVEKAVRTIARFAAGSWRPSTCARPMCIAWLATPACDPNWSWGN